MKVVNRNISFSKKQIRKNSIIEFSVLFGGLAVCIVLLRYFLQLIIEDKSWLDVSFVMFAVGTIAGLVIAFILFKSINKLNFFLNNIELKTDIARAGDTGERLVYDELKKVLDDSYTVYPNYIIPGHKFDLDFLIVGPKGLIVIEVKNFSNSTFFSGDQALSIKGSDYKKETTKLVGNSDPRVRIRGYSRVLNNYLNYLNLKNINIKKVLVFAKDHVIIEGKSEIYIVKKIYELDKYFDSLYLDEKFTLEFCDKLNEELIK